MRVKKQAIETILNNWFSNSVIKNKGLTFKFEIKNNYLKNQCSKLFSDIKKGYSFNSFTGEYILHCYLAMLEFKATGKEWAQMEELALLTDWDDTEARATGKLEELSKYVYVTVSIEMKRESMLENGAIMSVDGVRSLFTLNTSSLDFIGENNEGENAVSIHDILSSESNIFNNYDNQAYYKNSFRMWFDACREDILTRNQDEFLWNMNKVDLELDSAETIKSVLGVGRDKVNSKLDTIADRVVRAYNKQTLRFYNAEQTELMQRVELLTPIERYLFFSDEESQNQLIFDYVADNFEELQPLLRLTADECIALNRKEYVSTVVYKATGQLLERLDSYKNKLKEINNNAEEFQEIEKESTFVRSKQKVENDGKLRVFSVVGRDGVAVPA